MIGVMIAYAIFAAIMILIMAVVFIAAGISAIRRLIQRRGEGTNAASGSNQSGEP